MLLYKVAKGCKGTVTFFVVPRFFSHFDLSAEWCACYVPTKAKQQRVPVYRAGSDSAEVYILFSDTPGVNCSNPAFIEWNPV